MPKWWNFAKYEPNGYNVYGFFGLKMVEDLIKAADNFCQGHCVHEDLKWEEITSQCFYEMSNQQVVLGGQDPNLCDHLADMSFYLHAA